MDSTRTQRCAIEWSRRRDPRLDDLEHRVALLESALTDMVRREEGIGGFFAFLCATAPRYLSFVGHLRDEHRRLLAAAATLRAEIRQASDGDLSRLTEKGAALLADIDAHESLEREVLRDALDPL